MPRADFDVVAIGGGAGGLFAASVANALGARTCMIDKKRLGGDCTWFGCMPSKAILRSAAVRHLFTRSAEFGLAASGDVKLDVSGVMAHVREVVEEISTHHPPEVFERRGITVMFGDPEFVDPTRIRINDETVSARRFMLCPGAHPIVPEVDGLDSEVLASTENPQRDLAAVRDQDAVEHRGYRMVNRG